MSMSVREHDELWKGAYKEIPQIGENLRYHNLLMILNGLHESGFLTTEDYQNDLLNVAHKCGFNITKAN